MTRSDRRACRTCLAAAILAWCAPAAAADGAPDWALRAWAGPEATLLDRRSPYAGGADLAGLAHEAARAEAVLRLAWRGAVAEGSLRATTERGGRTRLAAVLTELYQELDVTGQHFTVGKRVTSWDVAYGFRPLDVVQQERRLALKPFALEGIPQAAWEWLDARWALTVVWANPVRGRAAQPVHDASGAARLFGHLGPLDLHLVTRGSERTGLQAGAGAALVASDALELHGSSLWQERTEHLPPPARGPGGSPLAAAPPGPPRVDRDQVAAVLGFTFTPGHDLSFLGEAWYDPQGDGAATWRARRRLAEDQRALGQAGLAPPAAVDGNLAWGLMAFDRPSPLRDNLLLHATQTLGRVEPALDLLFAPEDRGWVLTGSAAWQGERLRLEAGARVMGGPPGAAYRLYPGWLTGYAAVQLTL